MSEVYNGSEFTAPWFVPALQGLATIGPIDMAQGLIPQQGLAYRIIGDDEFKAEKMNDGVVLATQTDNLVYELTWTYYVNSPILESLARVFAVHKRTGIAIGQLAIRDRNEFGVFVALSCMLLGQPTRSPNQYTRAWRMVASGVVVNF